MDLNALQQAARNGDQRAEKSLFEILSVRLHRFAYQKVWDEESAKEIAQEALAVIARDYRGLEIHTSFAAWVHRVFQNRLLAYIKAKRVQEQRGGQASLEGDRIPTEETDPVLKWKLSECLQKVGRASRKYARILNLRYQGFGTDEICDRLDISVSNCYVLLSRARTMLSRCLEKDDIEP